MALLPEQVKDPIPYSIRMQHHLCELRYALEQIHFPDSMESKEIAKKRLVFEELFTLQLGLLELKYRKKTGNFPAAFYRLQQRVLPTASLRSHRRTKTCHFRGNGRYDKPQK